MNENAVLIARIAAAVETVKVFRGERACPNALETDLLCQAEKFLAKQFEAWNSFPVRSVAYDGGMPLR